jgi:hypothetical protein
VTETKYKSFRDVVWETVANFGASTYFDETFRTVGMDAVKEKKQLKQRCYLLIPNIFFCLQIIF